VPAWFVLTAAMCLGGSLGWMYHVQVTRWRAWRARARWF
jgi:hypothetical protein